MSHHATLHHEAMAALDESTLSKRRGRPVEAERFLCRAKELEVQAARAVSLGNEPMRSVLFRSAATLALDVGELQEARSLAMEGLSGGPPEEIEKELVTLITQIDGKLGGEVHGG